MSLDFTTLPDMLLDPDYQGLWPSAVSPNGRYVLINKYRAIWVLDRATELATTAFDPASLVSYSNVAIDNDGTIYAIADPLVVFGTGELVQIPNFGDGTSVNLATSLKADVPRSLGLFIMPDATKCLVWGENQDTNAIKVYSLTTGLSTVPNSAPQAVVQTRQDSYGDVWAISASTDHITFQRVVDGGDGTAAPDYNSIALATASSAGMIEVYHSSAGWFVLWDAGKHLYLLDDTDFSTVVHRDYAANGVNGVNLSLVNQPPFLLGLAPGADSFWLPGPVSYAAANYSDLHKINAADLTSLDTHDISDWAIGDDPDAGQGMIYSTYAREALISGSLEDPPTDDELGVADYTTVLRYFELSDSAGDGLVDLSLRLRVWSYILDGHAYAVFRLGPSESLIFDLTTSQWSSWASPGRDNWRAHVGQNWIGMSTDTLERGFGSDVVAGDDASNVLWILDPASGRDDRSTTGSDPFNRVVTGLVTIDGREVLNCGAVTLSLSLGNPSQDGATITLYTSDDLGQNFTNHGINIVEADEFSAVVEWRALGLGRAPGRLFKFLDNGAATRISAADLR